MAAKSTVAEIRERFDNDVERFSNLETGQQAAMDSVLCLDLITQSAAGSNPGAKALLDIGCGAGNWSIKLLGEIPGMSVTLLDLSRPMLDRAQQRVTAAGAATVKTLQGDVREMDFPEASFDLIVAGAVLHHLRGDEEWQAVFAMIHDWLKPGGSLWVFDMVTSESPAVEEAMQQQYRDHLRSIGGEAMVEKVLAYIDKEDSPRPLAWQLDLLREAGFARIDVLHKNGPFAAYGAVK